MDSYASATSLETRFKYAKTTHDIDHTITTIANSLADILTDDGPYLPRTKIARQIDNMCGGGIEEIIYDLQDGKIDVAGAVDQALDLLEDSLDHIFYDEGDRVYAGWKKPTSPLTEGFSNGIFDRPPAENYYGNAAVSTVDSDDEDYFSYSYNGYDFEFEKIDGKWFEVACDNCPRDFGKGSYMGYLTPREVKEWVRKDYGSYMESKGKYTLKALIKDLEKGNFRTKTDIKNLVSKVSGKDLMPIYKTANEDAADAKVLAIDLLDVLEQESYK